MVEVTGDDGQPDVLVGLRELCQWTGYSDEWILKLAREGVVRRRSRGKYLLRGSVRGLFDRAREHQQTSSLSELIALELGDFPYPLGDLSP